MLNKLGAIGTEEGKER